MTGKPRRCRQNTQHQCPLNPKGVTLLLDRLDMRLRFVPEQSELAQYLLVVNDQDSFQRQRRRDWFNGMSTW